MDFESCFTDCCMACDSLGPNFNTSSKIQGQGDCTDSTNFQEHQINWEKKKKLRNKLREGDKFGFKEDQQKNQLNAYCNCLKKNNHSDDFLDKIRNETKYEKKNIEIFQNCCTPWNSSYANWTNNKIKESTVFEGLRPDENLLSDRAVAETLADLKEKVEFLFKNFKDCNPKVFYDNCNEKSHGDYVGIMPGEVSHLFNINKRLSVAEKSIQKLTFILEDLLKDLNKRKAVFANKNLIFSEPLNFEEMPITQRINLLKNRNDFLFGFMRDFLQVRSVEELYSVLDLMPRDCESTENPWNSSFYFAEENQSNNFNREDVMETLKELRRQVSKDIKETPTEYEHFPIQNEKKIENPTKSYRNKLEVISEQAELALYYDEEHEPSEHKKKNNELLREKISQVKQESVEKDSGISGKTARLLAQEAMLKSSLDKADFDIFINRDSSEKNLTFTKNSPLTLTIETPTEDNNEGDTETSLDSSSVYWETEATKKSKANNPKKCRIQEYKKETKQGRNVDITSSSLPKRNSVTKTNKSSDAKNQSHSKVLHQKSHTVLTQSVKGKQNGCCLAEVNSFSRDETKKEVKTRDQRPMSTPGCQSKTLQTSGVKALVPEKSRKKISGINNVKNKNKLLLSQKSCVRTA